jgi:hypothetical protein
MTMPSSAPVLLSPIVNLVMKLRPASVLDVGCGAGKWGVLVREYLDWWGEGATGARRTRIDAVEIHEPYIGPLHAAVYDHLNIGDVCDFFVESELSQAHGCWCPMIPCGLLNVYDLILCLDVIEHFTREQGLRFLEAAARRCRTLLVSTPQAPSPQGAVFGNEHERHVSRWGPQDFEPFGVVQGWGIGGFWVVTVTPRADVCTPPSRLAAATAPVGGLPS